MTRKEIEECLEKAIHQQVDCERIIASLRKALLEHEEEIPDSPVFNDQDLVFYVNDDLDVTRYNFLADPPAGILPFNRFYTHEEAVVFSDMCKWNAMLLHCRHYLCPNYKPDWETDVGKYTIYLNTGYGKPRFEVDSVGHQIWNYGCVYFPSIDIAQKAADWMNKHWRYGE